MITLLWISWKGSERKNRKKNYRRWQLNDYIYTQLHIIVIFFKIYQLSFVVYQILFYNRKCEHLFVYHAFSHTDKDSENSDRNKIKWMASFKSNCDFHLCHKISTTFGQDWRLPLQAGPSWHRITMTASQRSKPSKLWWAPFAKFNFSYIQWISCSWRELSQNWLGVGWISQSMRYKKYSGVLTAPFRKIDAISNIKDSWKYERSATDATLFSPSTMWFPFSLETVEHKIIWRNKWDQCFLSTFTFPMLKATSVLDLNP